jgi:hypothetical protein
LDRKIAIANKRLQLKKLQNELKEEEDGDSKRRQRSRVRRASGESTMDCGELQGEAWADIIGAPRSAAGAASRQAYRVVDYLSSRKRRDPAFSQLTSKSGQLGLKTCKSAAVEAMSVGDWITGNANAVAQMVADGELIAIKDGKLDTGDLMELLKHIARVGDLLDLGFEKSRVWRYDDDCRLTQAASGSWASTAADIGLAATHLMAPLRQGETGGAGRQQRRRQGTCYDFNKLSGCQRTACKFAHVCRRCGQPHSEAAFHSDLQAASKN